MTFSLKCYCWCSKTHKSWEENVLWPVAEEIIILASLQLHSRTAPIPSQQAQCCSFKGELKIHFRSSSQVVAPHVNLCFHAITWANVSMFQCPWLQRFTVGDFKLQQRIIHDKRRKRNTVWILLVHVRIVCLCVWVCVQQAFDQTAQSVLVQMRQENQKKRFAMIKHIPVTGLHHH